MAALLLPAAVRRIRATTGGSATRAAQIAIDASPARADMTTGHEAPWSALIVAATLPLTVCFLFLWGTAASQLGANSWWIALAVILPAVVGGLYARGSQHRDLPAE